MRLWDIPGGGGSRVLEGHTGAVKTVAFSPDGRLLASGSLDHTVRLWRPDGAPVGVLRGHSTVVRGVGFLPDSERLVSFGRDETVKIWDVRSPPGDIVLFGLEDRVAQVAFRSDGDVVGLSRAGRAIRWETKTGRVLAEAGAPGVGVLLGDGESEASDGIAPERGGTAMRRARPDAEPTSMGCGKASLRRNPGRGRSFFTCRGMFRPRADGRPARFPIRPGIGRPGTAGAAFGLKHLEN